MNDHTLFITGASSGIGEACARRFVAAGARVILAARRVDRLAALQAELGERAWLLQLDVRDRASVLAAAEGLPEAFASVSVLVNNAGLALGLSSIEAIDLDDADTMIDTNLPASPPASTSTASSSCPRTRPSAPSPCAAAEPPWRPGRPLRMLDSWIAPLPWRCSASPCWWPTAPPHGKSSRSPSAPRCSRRTAPSRSSARASRPSRPTTSPG